MVKWGCDWEVIMGGREGIFEFKSVYDDRVLTRGEVVG